MRKYRLLQQKQAMSSVLQDLPSVRCQPSYPRVKYAFAPCCVNSPVTRTTVSDRSCARTRSSGRTFCFVESVSRIGMMAPSLVDASSVNAGKHDGQTVLPDDSRRPILRSESPIQQSLLCQKPRRRCGLAHTPGLFESSPRSLSKVSQ